MQSNPKPRIVVFDFQEDEAEPGSGRSTAENISAKLSRSSVYRIVDRKDWHEKLGREELTRESRFHPAWAVERLRSVGADAVVIGRVYRSPGGQAVITAMMVDASGVVLEKVERASADAIATVLCTKRLASKLRTRDRAIEAKIEAVRGSSLMLSLQPYSGLQRHDRLLIDRLIETVPDPFLEHESGILGHLTAAIGEALILDIIARLALAQYTGAVRPRIGEIVALCRI